MKKRTLLFSAALLSLLLIFSLDTFAQVYGNVGGASGYGQYVRTKTSERAEITGDPYLFSAYTPAFVRFVGAEPAVFAIKYDQLDDVVVVAGKTEGEEYSFNDPVLEFKFKDTQRLFRNGFEPTGTTLTAKSYYEVLFDGSTKYLKKNGKMIIESKTYNSATVAKKIEENNTYYIVKGDNKPVLVKNNEKSILSVLDKQAELTKYIKDNKLNLKNDGDVAKLLTYYDSLKQTS